MKIKKIVVGFTGTRKGMTQPQAAAFRRFMRKYVGYFHHGDCKGSDDEAANIVDEIGGYIIHAHPAKNSKYRVYNKPKDAILITHRPKNYGERDLDIVIRSAIMTAAPSGKKEIMRGSGTWLTIRMARAEHKPLVIFWPDGTIAEERMEDLSV